ncbi:MAG TPA: hypothetical protein VEO93_00805 [Gemmatimonadales bacterium]|nr:hypothetical protein [Gemmatimonadales bacterium]
MRPANRGPESIAAEDRGDEIVGQQRASRGRIWAEGVPNQGATSYFTPPRESKSA